MDPAATQCQIVMPLNFVVHPRSGCPCYKHNPGMLTRPFWGFHMPTLPASIPLLQYADKTTFFMEGESSQ